MECQRDEKATNSRHRKSTIDFFLFKNKVVFILWFRAQNFVFYFLSLCSENLVTLIRTRVNQNGRPEKKMKFKVCSCHLKQQKKRMLLCPSVCTDACVGVFAYLVVCFCSCCCCCVCAMGTAKIENILHLHRTLKSHLHANSLYAVSNIIHN